MITLNYNRIIQLHHNTNYILKRDNNLLTREMHSLLSFAKTIGHHNNILNIDITPKVFFDFMFLQEVNERDFYLVKYVYKFKNQYFENTIHVNLPATSGIETKEEVQMFIKKIINNLSNHTHMTDTNVNLLMISKRFNEHGFFSKKSYTDKIENEHINPLMPSHDYNIYIIPSLDIYYSELMQIKQELENEI